MVAPNHYGGRRITAGTPKSPKNVTSTFFNTINLLSKELRFEHRGAKLASCPGDHLTSLRPCWYILGIFLHNQCNGVVGLGERMLRCPTPKSRNTICIAASLHIHFHQKRLTFLEIMFLNIYTQDSFAFSTMTTVRSLALQKSLTSVLIVTMMIKIFSRHEGIVMYACIRRITIPFLIATCTFHEKLKIAARKRFTRGADIDTPSMQQSLPK